MANWEAGEDNRWTMPIDDGISRDALSCSPTCPLMTQSGHHCFRVRRYKFDTSIRQRRRMSSAKEARTKRQMRMADEVRSDGATFC